MELASYFQLVRNRSEELCKPLQVEDYTPQSVYYASPPKWHLAHTTWFFEEMILKQFVPEYQVIDPSYNFLFNSYYNTIGERIERDQRGLITRPSVEEVYEYRKRIDERMISFIEAGVSDEVRDLVILGLNHEQQHQELLLTDLKYTLSLNPNYPVYDGKDWTSDSNQSDSWVSISEGVYEIGHDSEAFCFDNELGRHKTYIQNFEISNCLVTNGEFLEFVVSGAYQDAKHWLDEGWAWVQENNITQPLYWKQHENKWYQYTFNGLQELNHNHILCHINYYEANAFANWKGMRLPTEFEWEVASSQLNWGQRWEWTNSAYLPYPGFKISEGAIGEYNGKFMINQMVLRGASVATSENHSRNTYRNFFHPQMKWQFTGIRLVK